MANFMNLPWPDDLFSEKDLQDIQAIIERSREDEPTSLSYAASSDDRGFPHSSQHEPNSFSSNTDPSRASVLQVDSSVTDHNRDEILVQAQGLYAGVALLNELEPLSETPAQIVLRHTGEVCDTEKVLFGSAPEPINQQDCELGGVSYDAEFERFTRHFEGRQSREDQWPKLLGFETFIANLTPCDSGKARCQYCTGYNDNEFWAHPSNIRKHYQFNHIEFALNLVGETFNSDQIRTYLDHRMTQPECASKIGHIMEQCVAILSNSSLLNKKTQSMGDNYTRALGLQESPLEESISMFFLQLRATYDGRLLCLHPKCSMDLSFEASTEGLEGHFLQHNCRNLLEHAGAFTEEQFLGQFTHNLSQSDSDVLVLLALAEIQKQRWVNMKSRGKRPAEPAEHSAIGRGSFRRDFEAFQKKQQWAVLRSLQAEFNRRNGEFLRFASRSYLPETADLVKSCNKQDELLESSILTVKDILTGLAPSSLKELYGFITLASSMAAVMRKRGVSVSCDPTENDFVSWRQCLKNTFAREDFDCLVTGLWLRDSPDKSRNYETRRTSDDWWFEAFLDLYNPPKSREAELSMIDTTTRMFNDAAGFENFDFSTFVDTQDLEDPFEDQKDYVDLSNAFSPEEPDDVPVTSGNAGFTQSNMVQEPPSSKLSSCSHADTGDPINRFYLASLLRGTLIFVQVLLFMTYIAQLGLLLCSLSCAGSSHFPDSRMQISAIAMNFSRFVEKTKYRILNPMQLDPSFAELTPLFAVAAKLVESGWLHCLRDLENYILSTVKYFSSSRKLFISLAQEILERCLQASDEVDHSHIYPHDTQEWSEYSAGYIRTRLERETSSYPEEACTYQSIATFYNEKNRSSTCSEDSNSQKRATSDIDHGDIKRNCHNSSSTSQRTSSAHSIPQVQGPGNLGYPPHPFQATPTQLLQCTCDHQGCRKTYNGPDSAGNLRRHKREAHKGISWSCPFDGCKVFSPRQHNLRQHWLHKHKGAEMPEGLRARKEIGGGGVGRKKGA